ncbi:MAG: winged helix-turn-helix domain-containing protein [Roseiarcus sp.]|jgi:predicted ATPase/DNA-binding winged helix-turn-helix (wHTH) protein
MQLEDMQSAGDKNARRDVRSATADEVRFGGFRYLPDQSLLLKDGKRVRIGSRALCLLKLLIDNAGQFVSNDTLIAGAWPNTHVDDTNLRVQMTALRRLLSVDGDFMRITNAPGRGYALTIVPDGSEASEWLAKPLKEPLPTNSLPAQLTSLVGREDAVATVIKNLSARRFVSVVGPGGIGKTRVAIEVCGRLIDEGDQRIHFVDLAPLASGEFVATAVASALTHDDEAQTSPFERIVRALRRSRAVLALDNCEHVLDTVATLSEGLLRAAPDLRILATSREPLLVDGEVIVRLAGLGGPGDEAGPLTLAQALAFPAIQLFAERAAAGVDNLSFKDSDAPTLVDICRRLDGIPLAIELAAARAASLGIQGVAALVRDQTATLSAGRRTAPPRQRTMRATLEWSYDKLSNEEKMLLIRLSIFRSMFSLAGAQAVSAAPPELTIQLLSDMVAKSLVVVDYQRAVTRFRLLEITRGFAEEKLNDSKDSADVRRRHAAHLVALFAGERTGVRTDPSTDRRQEFRSRVDDVRSAIGWSLSPSGDSRLGIRLIIDSAPMWISLSILGEYVAIIDGASERLWQDPGIDAKDAIWLAPSLHLAKYNVAGVSASMVPMLSKALRLAEQQGDYPCQLTCLWGLFGARLTEARYKESLDLALRLADLAPHGADSLHSAMSHRVVGLASWRNGDLPGARPHVDLALAPVDPNPSSPANQSLIYKHEVTARVSASNLLWLTGFADQAVAQAADAMVLGLEHDVLGLCYGLAQAIVPLAFWIGDLAQARAHTLMLIDLASDNGLVFWLQWGRSYECALRRLSSNLQHGADFIETNAASLCGLLRHILATILHDAPGPMADLEPPQMHWCAAELLRVQALGLLQKGQKPAAENQLKEALDISRCQGAFAWELRAATTLAELYLAEGKPTTAHKLLAPTIERATEGFETRDFRQATEIMARIDAA